MNRYDGAYINQLRRLVIMHILQEMGFQVSRNEKSEPTTFAERLQYPTGRFHAYTDARPHAPLTDFWNITGPTKYSVDFDKNIVAVPWAYSPEHVYEILFGLLEAAYPDNIRFRNENTLHSEWRKLDDEVNYRQEIRKKLEADDESST